MSKESDFLLGWCFSLLVQCRSHFIQVEDKEGLLIIEDEYEALKKCIERIFYHDQTIDR
jgi:hypothetical protein